MLQPKQLSRVNTPTQRRLVFISAKRAMQNYSRAIPSFILAADGHPFINHQQGMPLNS
jgi:hypothetical protein